MKICEILGVEVGEEFSVYGYGPFKFHIREDGFLQGFKGRNTPGEWICNIINHPENIIRKPRLTEKEREILKAAGTLGFKWVTREEGNNWVTVYPVKPVKGYCLWLYELSSMNILGEDLFKMVKWEDKEPTLITDLLGEV